MKRILLLFAVAGLLSAAPLLRGQDTTAITKEASVNLGSFSISLTVKDLSASKAFYEKLGFKQVGGEMEQNWIIMQNGSAVIGLFHGMFEKNILTFNPSDVRSIQKALKKEDVQIVSEADESTRGPASMMVKDPDGNLILLDQF